MVLRGRGEKANQKPVRKSQRLDAEPKARCFGGVWSVVTTDDAPFRRKWRSPKIAVGKALGGPCSLHCCVYGAG